MAFYIAWHVLLSAGEHCCKIFIGWLLFPQTAPVVVALLLSCLNLDLFVCLEAEAHLVGAEAKAEVRRVEGEVHARGTSPAGERAERRERPVGVHGRDEVAGAEEQAAEAEGVEERRDELPLGVGLGGHGGGDDGRDEHQDLLGVVSQDLLELLPGDGLHARHRVLSAGGGIKRAHAAPEVDEGGEDGEEAALHHPTELVCAHNQAICQRRRCAPHSRRR